MPRAYLGLGGNMGNPMENISEALRLLQEGDRVIVERISSYYETAPVGYEQQAWFMNIVAEIQTDLEPYALLALCNEVEKKLKRERNLRWGPRTIDIDILLYEDFESNTDKLTIPHPRMVDRAFVMIPLQEVAPDMILQGKSIEEIVRNLSNQEIRKLEND